MVQNGMLKCFSNRQPVKRFQKVRAYICLAIHIKNKPYNFILGYPKFNDMNKRSYLHYLDECEDVVPLNHNTRHNIASDVFK